MKKIDVNLDKKPYSILIDKGILKNAGGYINTVLPAEKHKKAFVVTEKNVNSFGYSDVLILSLENAGYECTKIVLEAGEKSKDFEVYHSVAEKILGNELTRNDFLIAIGGGVIGDLVGFLASTLLRGVPFVQIPTTLLAQVDSSVGGKTAINTKAGKNLIGTFYSPRLVIIDINTLQTLDKRNLKVGYVEAVKYGLINDKEFFEYCEKYGKDCINGDLNITEYIVEKSCANKAKIVEKDEFETFGIRVLLNLGHTFGHIYEKMTNYNSEELLHGEAVALGIRQAFILSEKLGKISHSEVKRVLNHFKELELFDFSDLKKLKSFRNDIVEYTLENMKKDKKAGHGEYNLVLVKAIGKAEFVKNVNIDDIKKAINYV